jgi:hypothetical protein
MPVSLGHSLNKAISVSIPPLFGDELPHVCILIGIDAGGVWLNITDPSCRLFQSVKDRISSENPNVFVPYAQIAYLLDSAVMANPNGTSGQPANASSDPDPAVETRSKEKKVSRRA